MATALFLDRDGVINEEKKGSYILSPSEFKFYNLALEAIVELSGYFDYVFIVTNQRGIGRKLMTEKDLHQIHDFLIKKIKEAGGKINKIYFASAIDDRHPDRKPNIGMALAAKRDFPDLDFSRSIMVGNNISDMKFGKDAGMKTIFLHTTEPKLAFPHDLADLQFDSLWSYAQFLGKSI